MGIPAVGISYAEGAALAAAPPKTARIVTETMTEERTTANILAETAGGDPTKVVLVGSHLDSVPEGPGINDNGTGSAFNLELAVQMAKLKAPANKVRFAWWGAEEEGLLGSTHYVGGHLRRGVRQHHAQPELRHAGVAQPREVRLRR